MHAFMVHGVLRALLDGLGDAAAAHRRRRRGGGGGGGGGGGARVVRAAEVDDRRVALGRRRRGRVLPSCSSCASKNDFSTLSKLAFASMPTSTVEPKPASAIDMPARKTWPKISSATSTVGPPSSRPPSATHARARGGGGGARRSGSSGIANARAQRGGAAAVACLRSGQRRTAAHKGDARREKQPRVALMISSSSSVSLISAKRSCSCSAVQLLAGSLRPSAQRRSRDCAHVPQRDRAIATGQRPRRRPFLTNLLTRLYHARQLPERRDRRVYSKARCARAERRVELGVGLPVADGHSPTPQLVARARPRRGASPRRGTGRRRRRRGGRPSRRCGGARRRRRRRRRRAPRRARAREHPRGDEPRVAGEEDVVVAVVAARNLLGEEAARVELLVEARRRDRRRRPPHRGGVGGVVGDRERRDVEPQPVVVRAPALARRVRRRVEVAEELGNHARDFAASAAGSAPSRSSWASASTT